MPARQSQDHQLRAILRVAHRAEVSEHVVAAVKTTASFLTGRSFRRTGERILKAIGLDPADRVEAP